MAQKFDPNYKITNGLSTFSSDFMNPIFQDIDLRIDRLERGLLLFSGFFAGVLPAVTRLAIFQVPIKIVKLTVVMGVETRPVGGDLVIDLLKGGEPGGGAGGVSLWAAAGSRPRVLAATNSGLSVLVAADQNLPLAVGTGVAIDTDTVGPGPAEGLAISIFGEPGA